MADLDTSVLFAGTARRGSFTQTATDIIGLKQRSQALTLEQARQETQREQFRINKAEGDQDQLFRQKALTERTRQFNRAEASDERDFQALEKHRAQQAEARAIDQASQQKGLQLRQALAVFEAAPDTPAGRQAVRDLITGMGGNPDLIPESVTDADVNKAITNAAKVFKECEQNRNRAISAAQKQACVTKAHTAAMAAIDAIGAMPDTPGSQQKRDFLNDQIRTTELGERAETRSDLAIERGTTLEEARTFGAKERGADAGRLRREEEALRNQSAILRIGLSATGGDRRKMKQFVENLPKFMDKVQNITALRTQAEEAGLASAEVEARRALVETMDAALARVPSVLQETPGLSRGAANRQAMIETDPSLGAALPPVDHASFAAATANLAADIGELVAAGKIEGADAAPLLVQALMEAGVPTLPDPRTGQPLLVDAVLRQKIGEAMKSGADRFGK